MEIYNKLKKLFILIAFFCIIIPFVFYPVIGYAQDMFDSDSAQAEAGSDKEPIIVDGDRVEYLYEEKKVVGVKNVVITYKDVKMTCDKIVVHMETKEAFAEGNVVLYEHGNIIRGEKVNYNFDTERGTIIEAEVRSNPWYGEGEVGSKVADGEYAIERGFITTCDLPHPHYRIQARRIKLFINDRIEARHLIIFIGDFPMFYFPYYVHWLNDKRPRVTILAGRNSRWGAYVLTAWRYYFHEWSRGYVRLDWREKKGFAEGFDYKYKLGYFGKGLLRFYYTDENHSITPEESELGRGVGNKRWRVQLRHKWQIDQDTLATGEFHKVSDSLFVKDYYYLDEFDKESEPQNYFSVIKTRPGYNLSFLTKYRLHNFYEVVEKLPELKMNITSQRVRETDFYYTSTTSFAMLQRKFRRMKDTDTEPKLKANRFDTEQEISHLSKQFGFLTCNPYIGLRETWYSEDDMENENELRHVYTFGTRFSTKFFRVFDVETDALALDINKLRHVINPLIDYYYTPTPNMKTEDIKQFDSVDAIEGHNGVDFTLVNTLQTKRGDDMEVHDLVRFSTSTGLLLHARDNKSIKDIRTGLILRPYSWLEIHSDSHYDLKENRLNSINADLIAGMERHWGLAWGFRFEEDEQESSSSQFTSDAFYVLSPRWKLKSYHRIKNDSDDNKFVLEEQTYGIERDLHCWLVEFNYQLKETEEQEVDLEHRFWITFRIKAFPELPFKMFSASYRGPTAGVQRKIPTSN
ncbi:MAG: LPS-assembly protein LptD [Candidatus Omnitrophica bacterium]|nr:LPS-assembly protein LptD [Candidatus Omnitrophota bacterium]